MNQLPDLRKAASDAPVDAEIPVEVLRWEKFFDKRREYLES